jgi:hypothetical protein
VLELFLTPFARRSLFILHVILLFCFCLVQCGNAVANMSCSVLVVFVILGTLRSFSTFTDTLEGEWIVSIEQCLGCRKSNYLSFEEQHLRLFEIPVCCFQIGPSLIRTQSTDELEFLYHRLLFFLQINAFDSN